jgi:hypothetical protein
MNRSKVFRHIFAELNQALGNAATQAEILDCARIVMDCAEDADVGSHYKWRKLRTPFVEMGVDELIDKWSWKIMCREYRPQDDYDSQQVPQDLINQLLHQAA